MEETGRSAWLAPAVRPTPRRPRGATAGASSAFPVRPDCSVETVENVGGLTPLIGTRLAPTLGAGPPVRVAIPASETPLPPTNGERLAPGSSTLGCMDRPAGAGPGERDEVAGHGGTGRSGGHCRVARGQRRRGHDDRILGGNAG